MRGRSDRRGTAGFIYVHGDEPGLRRCGTAKGFRYLDDRGQQIRSPETLQRIRALAIPPAWSNVWICANKRGHIQATGRDARGRKQYRYHPDWRAARDADKFTRMLEFGRALPRIRAAIARDLQLRGLPRDKVLAAVVRLIDLTHARVGNDEYARTNKSYGLTTLENRHAEVTGSHLRLHFGARAGRRILSTFVILSSRASCASAKSSPDSACSNTRMSKGRCTA